MFPKSINIIRRPLEVRIDDNAELSVFTGANLHFKVLKYFVRNSALSLALVFRGSKFLSVQN